jgi:hypothetical protein
MKVKYLMIFKSTYQILNNPWKEDVPNIDPFPAVRPPSRPWKETRSIKLDDVNLWEQIFYEPGVIGVYAAWDPADELYLVTYNCFLEENSGYKLFYGNTAVDDVIEELKILGINIPVRVIKVP